MKNIVWTSVLVFVLSLSILTTGCASAPTLPPGGQVLYAADEVMVAFGTLQHAAIELNKKCTTVTLPCVPIVSTANANVVVDVTKEAVTLITATPSGWKAIASTALSQIQSRLDAAGKTKLSAYIDALKKIAGLL